MQQIPDRLGRQFPGYELESGFAQRLANFLGEALDNAAEHGAGDWWIAASFRKLEEPLLGRCQIVIFNFGSTFEETILEMPRSSPRWEECRTIGDIHRAAGFFDGNWTEENFWTVAALQDGVSRLGDEDPSGLGSLRGAGTIEIIRLFDHLVRTSPASRSPRMCLVSGRTSVHFDERFPLKERRQPGQAIKFALNQPNDLNRPANPSVVRTLGRRFPGTLLSVQFHLGPDHLQPLPETHDQI